MIFLSRKFGIDYHRSAEGPRPDSLDLYRVQLNNSMKFIVHLSPYTTYANPIMHKICFADRHDNGSEHQTACHDQLEFTNTLISSPGLTLAEHGE